MRYLIAFDKFKDNMSARLACESAARALHELDAEAHIQLAPLADGGEGFAEILTQSAGGEIVKSCVVGPVFEPVVATWGLIATEEIDPLLLNWLEVPIEGTIAVIEMAQAAGLEQLKPHQRNPWKTTTFGVGELLAEAARSGASSIILGIGGSATNDAGVGALMSMGLELVDNNGSTLSNAAPMNWHKVDAIQGRNVNLPPIRIACDARFVSGFELVSRWLRLEALVDWADVVITGEGCFDRSSLEGKGPGLLIDISLRKSKRVIVFAGMVDTAALERIPLGIDPEDIRSIEPEGMTLQEALKRGPENLRHAIFKKFA